MTRLRLPVLLLAGLTLSACGSEPVPNQLSAPAELPSPSPSPSASAPPTGGGVLPAGPDDQPEQSAAAPVPEAALPEQPRPAADQAAEVEQFVRDYYAAVNQVLRSGDVASLETYSIPECDYCRNDREFLARNLARGTIEGSHPVIRSITVQSVGPETASVLVDMFIPDGRVVGPDGETLVVIDNGDGGPATHALFRTPGGWKIAQVLEG